MIHCPQCNFKNPDTARFCGDCGFNIASYDELQDADLNFLNLALKGKIKIEKLIGRGGMASVYLGTQLGLDRQIVVKLINREYSQDQGMIARFLEEAKTTAKYKHPQIVEVIDVGIHENRPYYIMEYLPNGSLEEKLSEYKTKNHPFPLMEALKITAKVLSALDFCHKKGLGAHRDIKPENIMFSEDDLPKLVDFGIAKTGGENKTQTGYTIGTSKYMSPEQCEGKKDIDGRSDIYSVGIMLYELLVGDAPFTGNSAVSVANKHINEKLPKLSSMMKAKFGDWHEFREHQEEISQIELIIGSACEKDRDRRISIAKEMEGMLSAVINDVISFDKRKQISTNISGQAKFESAEYTDEIENTISTQIDKIENETETETKNGVRKFRVRLLFAGIILLLAVGAFVRNLTYFPENIIIESIPSGASVTDMTTYTVVGKTPYRTSKSEFGTYDYLLKLEGY
ncbi:MAG: protein kinase [Leptospira sp.]|nr:protein kinase [Leptospira sp.]